VQDLLLISELEEKGATLQLSEVNLKNMVEDVLRIFEQKLRDKKTWSKVFCSSVLGGTRDVDNNLPLIKADVFKLEQMSYYILIDNAIKYTEKGRDQRIIKAKRW